MYPSLSVSKKTRLQTVFLAVKEACTVWLHLLLLLLGFCVFITGVTYLGIIGQHLFTLSVSYAKNGNPWPALIYINLIGILISLAIRRYSEQRRVATPSTPCQPEANGSPRVHPLARTAGTAALVVAVGGFVLLILKDHQFLLKMIEGHQWLG